MDFEEEKETKKILDLLSDLKPCNLNEKGKEELIYEIDNEKGNEYLNETETLYNITIFQVIKHQFLGIQKATAAIIKVIF